MFSHLKAATAAVLLVPGLAAAGTLAVGSAAASPEMTSLATFFNPACGSPLPGSASCRAIQLLSPSEHWGGGRLGKAATPASTAAPTSGYFPADLQSAYGLSSAVRTMSAGAGAPTVAIVDAYDDPNAISDLNAFRSAMNGATDPNTGLTGPAVPPLCSTTVTSGCVTFNKYNETGGTTLPAGNSGWSEEISLDLDTISSVCPDCNIDLVEASSASMSDLAQAASEAKNLGATVVTNSYGGSEWSSESSYNSIYSSTSTTAVTVSAGDTGNSIEFPAADPSTLAVGGTSITYTGSGSSVQWQSPSVWADSGSGCSAYEAAPSWQQDQGVYQQQSVCSHRSIADISADANPQTGVATYDTYGENGWMVFGGTSLSAQIIGAIYAVASTTGQLLTGPQTLYTDAGTASTAATPGLVPVLSGSDSSCGNYTCNAADSLSSGYNGPGGLGSPYGLSALTASSATAGSLSFSPSSTSVTAGAVSSPLAVDLSQSNGSATSVTLATSSSTGGFSTSATGPFSSTLSLSVPSGSSATTNFYYTDTTSGTPKVTGSASGWSSAALSITVSAGALTKISVSPGSATVTAGSSQAFTATGADAYGNPVALNATWSTTVPGGSVTASSGAAATFKAGSGVGTGTVTATQASISGSAQLSVTVPSTSSMTVSVSAGSLSSSRGEYQVPLTVSAHSASSGAALSGASVTLSLYTGSSCSGSVAAQGSASTNSSGQVVFTFQTRSATTWCAKAAVSSTGYSSGSGQTTFNS